MARKDWKRTGYRGNSVLSGGERKKRKKLCLWWVKVWWVFWSLTLTCSVKDCSVKSWDLYANNERNRGILGLDSFTSTLILIHNVTGGVYVLHMIISSLPVVFFVLGTNHSLGGCFLFLVTKAENKLNWIAAKGPWILCLDHVSV